MKNALLRLGCLCVLLCPLLPVEEAFAALSNGCDDVKGKTDRRVSDVIWQEIQAAGWTFSEGETLKVTFSNPSKSSQTMFLMMG